MVNKNKSLILSLGFFDGLHKGHLHLLRRTEALAKSVGVTAGVLAFKDDITRLTDKKKGVVFTFKERIKRLNELGFNTVIERPFDETTLNTSAKQFLDDLRKDYDVLGFVFGEDFTYGKNKSGNSQTLISYCKENGLLYDCVSVLNCGEIKYSTTKVKALLESGDVKKANELLPLNYFVSGRVFEDRKVGTKIGFPTINLVINAEKIKLKNAVYSGYIYLGKKKHKAIINYGARPTFNLNESLIEAHILNFNGNLYGKDVTLYFTDFMREIVKFNDVKELTEQLQKDVERVKND